MNKKLVLIKAMPLILFGVTVAASAIGASLGLKTIWGEVPAICAIAL